uniref:U-box domain-containing protein n=1 Tax=Branchiostoma floridae TaxID=7739 RepID=C3ZPL2_BRAFL|eukprot:XP_002589498.1 hypothetical protein BRAFLDRAFT_88357 [Branchiostoma floridae]
MKHHTTWTSTLLTSLIAIIGLMCGAYSTDPCTDYRELNQVRRSSAAEVQAGHSLLCDNTLTKDWYRFISYVGGEIPTTCVEPYHCGTQVPIWMNGTLPTDSTVVNRTVCPNYGVPGNCCPFPWNIQVKRCVDTQGVFYVYELVPTTSCSQAYCAGTLPICPEGEVYDQYNDICLDGGHFLYVGSDTGQQPLDTARIIGPVIVPSVVRPCNMTFSYYCSGPDAGDLDVLTRQYYTGVERPAWQESAGTAGVWTQGTVSFQEQDPFQVILQGVIGYSRDVRIAIDDISFSWDCVREVDGSVRLVDGARFDEGRVEIYYNHRWGTICNIGWTQTSADVCDFTDDCGDRSDESDCGSYPGRCDFQNGLCNWVQLKSDSADWTRGLGGSETGVPLVDHEGKTAVVSLLHEHRRRKPVCSCRIKDGSEARMAAKCSTRSYLAQTRRANHRKNNISGFYIFIDSSGSSEGKKAQIVSPVFTDDTFCQFRFFYHMQGRNIGSLHVLVRNVKNGSTEEVWRRQGQQGRGWLFGSVSIGTKNRSYQVLLEAVVGNGDQGDIAVDDVSFATYCTLHTEGDRDGLSSTTVTIIAVSSVAVVLVGIGLAVFIVYWRRKKIKKERYRNNNQNNSNQLGRLPARPELGDGNLRTYEDLRGRTTNNYESLIGAGRSVTQAERFEPDGAYAIPAYASSKDLFSVDTSSQASLVKNTVGMATAGNENNYTMLVDDRLRNFLKINGFDDYINIMAENHFTYEHLQSCKEVDLINIGVPLAKAHAIMSAFRGEGTYEYTRSNEIIPSKYICPISNSVMKDPVRANDGCIYDRAAITAWYERNGCTPNLKDHTLDLQSVDDLREEIEKFRKRRQNRANNSQSGHDVRPDSAQSDSSRCATPMTDVDC